MNGTPDRLTFAESLREHLQEIGIPRLLIGLFLVALFAVAIATKMNIPGLVTDCILRVGRNGLLVLALLPAVQGGVGLNCGIGRNYHGIRYWHCGIRHCHRGI